MDEGGLPAHPQGWCSRYRGCDGGRVRAEPGGQSFGPPGAHQVRPLPSATGPTGIHPQGRWSRISSALSLTLADLGSVCERVLHAMPDMRWNFDTVSAWPRHERNLMRPYFAPHRGNGVAEGGDGFGIPRGGSDLELA